MIRAARKTETHDRGLRAELVAALYLTLKGYKIVARRYKTPLGEIDLVARRGRALAMVEVKHRPSAAAALEAVSRNNQRRVTRAAHHFLAAHPAYMDFAVRFDVVTVTGFCRCAHLDNAWQADS